MALTMTDARFNFSAADESGTVAFARALAEALPPGTVVALDGVLGAGKTRLVQAVAEALGVDRRAVTSPTFVLVQQYQGRMPIYHVDAYRLRDEDEFLQLGVEEYFSGDGLVFIEWANRVANCLPRERLEIVIAVTGPDSRAFEITARGRSYAACIDALRERLSLGNSGR
jgi:tRNA threonylcarbamoyladenosine biosynthesis protein TsaE